MANFYSSQYTDAYVDVPSDKLAPGDQSGDVKSLICDHTFTAELTTSDTLYLGKIPAGARVLAVHLRFPASGATGIVDVGYLANGVDSVDVNGFVEGADPGAAAVMAFGTGAAIGKKFTAETTITMIPTENTASATATSVRVMVLYAVA